MTSISHDQLQALFRATPLIESLPDDAFAKLAGNAKELQFRAGETIFSKGEPGSHGYWLVNGRIRLTVAARNGAELLLSMVEAGGQFGEISAIEGGARSSTATAEVPSDCVAVDRPTLVDAVEGHHETTWKLVTTLSSYIRQSVDTIEMLGLHNSEVRVWYRLTELSERYGQRNPTTNVLKIEHGFSQQALADSVGLNRVVVNRQLSIWRDLGLIRYQRGVTEILDPKAFEDYVWRDPHKT